MLPFLYQFSFKSGVSLTWHSRWSGSDSLSNCLLGSFTVKWQVLRSRVGHILSEGFEDLSLKKGYLAK